MFLQEMLQNRKAATDKCDAIVTACEKEHRKLTEAETQTYDAAIAEVKDLDKQIARVKELNTLRVTPTSITGQDATRQTGRSKARGIVPVHFTEEYHEAFWHQVAQGRLPMDPNAALYEGSNAAGGYAVPVVVDDVIVPLAPNESVMRDLATVIATASDVKLPIKATKGTAAYKSESGGSDNAFTGVAPTLTQKTLSSYMLGDIIDISFELAQDVPAMTSLATQDMQDAVVDAEENKFINGTGSGEPEGVLATTGSELGAANEDLDADRVLDCIGALKAKYLPNAQWLMHRLSGISFRKQQITSNQFLPFWTREGTTEYLHGYKVNYSSYMPSALTQGQKPLVFGDFKAAMVIGDRGGSGINLKVLDQPKAYLGLIQFLAYRRSDSRIRRTEALKYFVIDAAS